MNFIIFNIILLFAGFLAVLIFSIAVLVYYFVKVTPKDQLVGFLPQAKKIKKRTKFLEGLRLVISNPYLLGIFAVVSFYQIIIVILDFQFKCLASETFFSCKDFGLYLFDSAIWVNGMAILCLVFGVNNIGRRLGLTASLVLLPILIAVAVFVLKTQMVLSVAFWVIVFCKAINYALNQPSKEQLYIPTTKDAKYKSKAWIDMFGSRGSKSVGSTINLLRPVLGPALFVVVSSGISLFLVVLWIFVGIFLGSSHAWAVKNKKAVC